MAQTYQMKHNVQGTIYSLLTVENDGAMTMTFHGTDREISHEANVTEDGRIATGGSLFPGLESGKWIEASPLTPLLKERETEVEEPKVESEPLTVNHEPLTMNQPKRQRKPRKPRVEREKITVNPEPLTVNHQSSSTR